MLEFYFFNMHLVGTAAAELAMLLAIVLLLIRASFLVANICALIQIPYALWSAFASVLNPVIYFLN